MGLPLSGGLWPLLVYLRSIRFCWGTASILARFSVNDKNCDESSIVGRKETAVDIPISTVIYYLVSDPSTWLCFIDFLLSTSVLYL